MRFLVILFICLLGQQVTAQEILAKVTVNASRISSNVDRRIFTTLQNQLTNFINNRKWTSDVFKPNEKIECSFLINIESVVEANVYKAGIIIQAGRPIYNSSYQSGLLNFQDPDFAFKYLEFQNIEFNESRIQGNDPLAANLSATIAFYIYTILGLDYNSFSPKAGDIYFQKALNIVNNAPEASNISGWKLFDGLRTRYWLNENLINSRYNLVHDVLYSYYRAGLDKLADNETEARSNIYQALNQLQAFNQENTSNMIVQVFLQNRFTELVGIFKKAPAPEKQKMADLLAKLDIANAQRYRDELK